MQIVPPESEQPLRIVLPGGSGQLGQVLARHFQERGHHVTVLTRGPYTAPWQTVHWDGKTAGPWVETLEGADVCINLAGRSVNCRSSAANRLEIYNSRMGVTRLLGQVIAGLESPPWLWMNASTAAIYRPAPGRDLDEASGELGGSEALSKSRHAPDSCNFLAAVAGDCEAAFFDSPTPRTRKIALRSATVFSPTPGNAFSGFSMLVRLSLGGWLGSGRQFVSWIHEQDFARAVEYLACRGDIDGPVNLTAPTPLPNRQFMAALREAWEVPNGFPVPSLLVKLGAFLMRTEPELVLRSLRVVPGRLLDAGFVFDFSIWSDAAEYLVHAWRHRHD
jgi:uncharacterized protein (TIGR01777 family)